MTNAQIEIRDVFAEVTRYPVEVLDMNASLEEDLGIDSVKLGEVFSVLRERFNIPADMDLPKEQLSTIAGVANALAALMATRGQATPAVQPLIASPGAALAGEPAMSAQSVEDRVLDVFAEITRYPREVLDPTADLEEDLGIDSVKLGEVFSVLRERYTLPAELDVPKDQLRSLRAVAAALAPFLAPASVAAPLAAAAPLAVNGNGHAAYEEAVPVAHHGKTNGSAGAPVIARAPHTNGSTTLTESESAALYAADKPVSKPFKGKVLFVSGSGRGMGKDIASYLAELGASVVINSFHSRPQGEATAKEINDRGGDAIHVWGSMANPEHVEQVFKEIDAKYGRLDFYIGNASNGMLAKLEDITVKDWEKAYRTNVIGLHQCSLLAVERMRKVGGGKIITLSSPASQGYVDYFGCMGTVKAAVESLTRSMAIEFAKYNVQVNCVSPGPVYGDLLNKWPESERLVRQWENNTAYGRLCESRDVSHFIAYLLSEPVKLFTGSVLVLDGGISSQGW
jgi:enoyl-[acyl-carrier protein] reductase III